MAFEVFQVSRPMTQSTSIECKLRAVSDLPRGVWLRVRPGWGM